MTADGWTYSPGSADILTPLGRPAFMPFPVAELLPVKGVAIVRLAPDGMPAQEASRNILALSEDGSVLWRIAPHPMTFGQDPFLSLERTGDTVRIYNFNGFALFIDPQTGAVLRQEETR